MAIIYVVGPSRAGKSELCKDTADDKCTHHRNLDRLLEKRHGIERADALAQWSGGWEHFWKECLNLIQEIEQEFSSSESSVLIDVGAGMLRVQEGCQYFIERGQHTIFVWIPEEAYRQRHVNVAQSSEKEEYGDWPTQLRNAARFCIDTTKDKSTSLQEFREALTALIDQAS